MPDNRSALAKYPDLFNPDKNIKTPIFKGDCIVLVYSLTGVKPAGIQAIKLWKVVTRVYSIESGKIAVVVDLVGDPEKNITTNIEGISGPIGLSYHEITGEYLVLENCYLIMRAWGSPGYDFRTRAMSPEEVLTRYAEATKTVGKKIGQAVENSGDWIKDALNGMMDGFFSAIRMTMIFVAIVVIGAVFAYSVGKGVTS